MKFIYIKFFCCTIRDLLVLSVAANVKHFKAFILLIVFSFLPVLLFSQSIADTVTSALLRAIEKDQKKEAIILVGEQNHATREHYQASFNLIKELVLHHNYDILLTESDFIDTFIALQKSKGYSLETIRVIYKDSQEFETLKEFDGNIIHAGFDCQVSLSEVDVAFLVNYFQMNKEQQIIFEDGIYLLDARKRGGDSFERLLEDLLDKHKSSLDKQLLKNLLVCSKIRVLEEKYAPEDWKPYYGNLRDKMMAENILFWYNYFGKEKFIALGAATHLAYGFSTLEHTDLAQYISAGAYLKQWSGSLINQSIFNISFSSAKGWRRPVTTFETEEFEADEGTVEAELLVSGKAYEIRKLSENPEVTAQAIDNAVIQGNYAAVWDYLAIFANASGLERIAGEGYVVEVNSFIQSKVVDGQNDEVVPFANVLIEGYNEGTNANMHGQFQLRDIEAYQDKVVIISSVGYETKKIPFSVLKAIKVVKLQPAISLLDEVIVNGKAETPKAVLIKAINKLEESAHQKHKNYFQTRTQVADATDTLVISTINEITILNEKEFAVNIIGSKPYDKRAFNKLGINVSFPWRGILQYHYLLAPPLKMEKLDKFAFSFDEELSKAEGIVINFKALNLSRRILNGSGVSSYEGQIWLNSGTYQLEKVTFNVRYEKGDYFSTVLFYQLIDKELIPVYVHDTYTIGGNLISSYSSWLKSESYTGQRLIMNHDFVSVRPSKEQFETFNSFME